jgi:16S rRNA (cytidine1402-2'-O)-methyltransferase
MAILYLVSTPIGNLEDITLRAAKVLLGVPVVACEDTRLTGRLLSFIRSLAVTSSQRDLSFPREAKRPEFLTLSDVNEQKKVTEVIHYLEEGNDVALVADAGTPLLSDPGIHLVTAAIARGISITAIPGPSALLAAAELSGFPLDRVLSWGFLPKKPGGKSKMLQIASSLFQIEPMTIVFFDSPFRIRETLDILDCDFPNCQLAVFRELTKIHEEIYRGKPAEVSLLLKEPVRGEITLVVRFAQDSSE